MYHCWRCLHIIIVLIDDFFQIISPPLSTIRKRYAGGENLLGADIECEYLEEPNGYYKAFGCKNISSDEDIGVALKKVKKGFFRLGRTHYLENTEDKENIELFKKAKEQYELQKTAFKNLGTLNHMGNDYANRVVCDRKGEELDSKFTTVFEERCPDSTFAQQVTDIKLEAEQADMFSKGQATRFKKTDMDALQYVANKWKNSVHQLQ